MPVHTGPAPLARARLAATPSAVAALVLVPLVLLAGCQPPPTAEPGVDDAARDTVRRAINSQLPARPYSEAVQAGETFYFSGRIAVTDETRAMGEGRIEAETRAVMEDFRALLAGEGLGFDDVVQGTVYLADIADYDGMNRVYAEYFPVDPPARETVAVREIVAGAAVEISFIAVAR
jgi:2-iminobutanoate/2-iminopropanoate deaminase